MVLDILSLFVQFLLVIPTVDMPVFISIGIYWYLYWYLAEKNFLDCIIVVGENHCLISKLMCMHIEFQVQRLYSFPCTFFSSSVFRVELSKYCEKRSCCFFVVVWHICANSWLRPKTTLATLQCFCFCFLSNVFRNTCSLEV